MKQDRQNPRTPRLVYDLTTRNLPEAIGNKARNLRRLSDAGFLVPRTYVCPDNRCGYQNSDDENFLHELKKELALTIDPDKLFAVRSSANLEDQITSSFAGQFTSCLDVKGVDEIIRAAQSIWRTTRSDQVTGYLAKHNLDANSLYMAILIQEMVTPIFSGVAFSRNPVTGEDEVVVEAVSGNGITLMQTGTTPMRWIYKNNRWMISPKNPVIPDELILDVVRQTREISRKFQAPVDLEWVFNGVRIYWVQMREITSLKSIKIYSNKISKDMLPGMICPLVWSINIPMINSTWIEILTEVIGPNNLQPEEMARAFYFRTYFEMGTFRRLFLSLGMPEDSMETMLGVSSAEKSRPKIKFGWAIISKTPRLAKFFWDKSRFRNRIRQDFPELKAQVQGLDIGEIERMSEEDIFMRIKFLKNLLRRIAYFNIITPLILSMHIRSMRRRLSALGINYDRLDIIADSCEITSLDPSYSLRLLNNQFRTLDEVSQQLIREKKYEELKTIPGIEPFLNLFQEFLNRFGHLSDSNNDFSISTWREKPAVLMQMAISHPEAEGCTDGKIRFDDLPIHPFRRELLRGSFNNLRDYWIHREVIGATYTRAYSFFRLYFVELAKRFTERNVLKVQEDIFYLTFDEVIKILGGKANHEEMRYLIEERKVNMELCRNITLPSIIYGDDPAPINFPVTHQLIGTPTSGGVYTGRCVVIKNMQDWGKMTQGAVLVVPYSDVGWTPLFLKAGALVSESGGILSHGSIIAREYNLPAVVSVENTSLLADGTLVTVDGYQGVIMIHD